MMSLSLFYNYHRERIIITIISEKNSIGPDLGINQNRSICKQRAALQD